MPAPSTSADFLELIRKSGLVEPAQLETFFEQQRTQGSPNPEARQLAHLLIRQGLLTCFQAEQLLRGKWRGFTIGKYKLLEQLGSGGMGIVYLCEHKFMRRRVAVKVLPIALARDPWFLEQFYREAQFVAALDHPNIVRAYDIDQDGSLHFLVMEYVDGSSLQVIVKKQGPMNILRACHYIRQAAQGLQHAYEVGLVHRDIKPGNLLLDRHGTVKILDMGLAHFFDSQRKALRNKEDARRMVGTTDYLAPEQVVDSDDVDIRADIYSLGATFYYLLTGSPPFHDVSLTHQILIQHITRRPKPVRDLRPDVPEALVAIVDRMMAKNPWDRYRTPEEAAEALATWTQEPIAAPSADEMPRLSPAAQRSRSLDATPLPVSLLSASTGTPVLRTGPPPSRTGSGSLSDPSRVPTPQTGSAATVAQRAGDTVKDPPPPATPPAPERVMSSASSVNITTGTDSATEQESSLVRECIVPGDGSNSRSRTPSRTKR